MIFIDSFLIDIDCSFQDHKDSRCLDALFDS